ncbi:hypothetical protein B296_00053268, partial [Ensete ventricosum]
MDGGTTTGERRCCWNLEPSRIRLRHARLARPWAARDSLVLRSRSRSNGGSQAVAGEWRTSSANTCGNGVGCGRNESRASVTAAHSR